MAARTPRHEVAFMAFSAEFDKIGIAGAPEALTKMLESYKIKPGETPAEMRHRIYRRLWCIMWHGSGHIGQEVVSGKDTPTYVYPAILKAVIRALIPGDLADYPDPTGSRVYNVTLTDLKRAKWPATSTKNKKKNNKRK
ncbi:hypothetical protein QZH41_020595 [Actinostola sp. cb2023]|nr:hypothetical protein QZH41_020595 [Actinostola sp. cb2023]